MASTTLFAPQVRSVQPAFVYNKNSKGKVKIYFSLSDYNQNLENFKIRYTLIDPNINSSWGSNSMIQNSEYIEIDSFEINNNKEYYFEIDFSAKIEYPDEDKLKDVFKELSLNQYYQIQLQLVQGSEESLWSQVTLIRPIPAHEIFFEMKSEATLLTLDKISGWIQYDDNSEIEAIKEYYVKITDNAENVVYPSKVISNVLGTRFATNLYDCYLDDGEYNLSIVYTTINGYSAESETISFSIGAGNINSQALKDFKISPNYSLGGNTLNFTFKESLSGPFVISIQRSSEKDDFKRWIIIKKFKTDILSSFKYDDLTIDSETCYRYRFGIEDSSNNYYIADTYQDKKLEIISELEDIHLLGEDKQLSIRYNPNISGFKYVTQEGIANTLGGKFPVVRVNGDTKYRQFSLSGTLSFNGDYSSLGDTGIDSTNKRLSRWIKNDNCTLLFDLESTIKNFSNISKELIKKPKSSYLEKKFRTIAMEFLTDRKPKLFKGAAEESMIVYLSNVSFTPNKTLGREVWDFSCTVTEICEFNRENLIKNKLIKSDSLYTLMYILRMKDRKDGNGNVTHYVPLEETFNNLPIIQAFWKEYVKGYDN